MLNSVIQNNVAFVCNLHKTSCMLLAPSRQFKTLSDTVNEMWAAPLKKKGGDKKKMFLANTDAYFPNSTDSVLTSGCGKAAVHSIVQTCVYSEVLTQMHTK